MPSYDSGKREEDLQTHQRTDVQKDTFHLSDRKRFFYKINYGLVFWGEIQYTNSSYLKISFVLCVSKGALHNYEILRTF